MKKTFDLEDLRQNKENAIDALLQTEIVCDCGKIHSCEIEKVLIQKGALNELPKITREYKNVLLVSDENTQIVAGKRVKELLSDKINSELVYTSDGFLVPDEAAVSKLEAALTDKTDLIIGVGSGVINDLCKHVSCAHALPYYIVATAPSMDGYASKGAAMIFGGMKITTNARVPKAIIADTEIISKAPLDMLKAGYGDIIGKYSCLNDWRLSNVVNGEPLCDFIYKLTYDTVISVAELGEKIISRDEEAIATLMRALVVVGIAMAYMGNSRPASGSEHHLSHYFEVVGLLRGEEYFCHGIDVAYSTYVSAKLRRELLEINEPELKAFDENSYEENVRRIYKGKHDFSCAEGIISLQKKLGWIYEDKSGIYREKWQEIKKILQDSPTPEKVLEMLSSAGLLLEDFENMYSREKLCDAVGYAKYLKDRYTVLWLYDSIKL